MRLFVCAELPLVATGPGLALGLPISLVPDESPRWVPLGKGLGAVCFVPTDTRLRVTSLVLIWRRQEGEQLCVFLRASSSLGFSSNNPIDKRMLDIEFHY